VWKREVCVILRGVCVRLRSVRFGISAGGGVVEFVELEDL
jgi:hypothetical protein